MLGALSEIGAATLRLYIAAASAALLVVFFVTAFILPRTKAGAAVRAMLVVLGAVVGAALAWAFADGSAGGDRGGERRILQARAEELMARSLAPGSALACLDAAAGNGVEAACEKAIFSSPTNVAAATSYVAARFALLSELVAYAKRGGGDVDDVLLPVRSSLEADRFGFLAHLLASRDACTSQNCKALALLRDPSQVRMNLSEDTFDHYLGRYQAAWAKPTEGTTAEIQAAPTARVAASAPRQIVNADFPSAASIPAVSIMNPEPSGPVLPGVAAAAAANPNPAAGQASARRSRKQTAAPAPQAGAAPITPPAAPARSAAAVEPIWPEPVPAPPAQQQPSAVPAAAAPIWPEPVPPPAAKQQPSAVPAAAAPTPFNPFGPGPNPNASVTVPAQ